MELKEEHRRKKISDTLIKGIGHQPATAKEKRVHAASAAVLAGNKIPDVEKQFAVRTDEMQRYIQRAFPEEQDRFKFLEECSVGCAIVAQEHFLEHYQEMTPEGAARAYGIFADKAVAIRKARESGFQEPQVNVAVLLNLQETLKKLTTLPNA